MCLFCPKRCKITNMYIRSFQDQIIKQKTLKSQDIGASLALSIANSSLDEIYTMDVIRQSFFGQKCEKKRKGCLCLKQRLAIKWSSHQQHTAATAAQEQCNCRCCSYSC